VPKSLHFRLSPGAGALTIPLRRASQVKHFLNILNFLFLLLICLFYIGTKMYTRSSESVHLSVLAIKNSTISSPSSGRNTRTSVSVRKPSIIFPYTILDFVPLWFICSPATVRKSTLSPASAYTPSLSRDISPHCFYIRLTGYRSCSDWPRQYATSRRRNDRPV
jgi:hypothetical protein